MTINIKDEELQELLNQYGTSHRVATVLRERGIEISDRTIRHRLQESRRKDAGSTVRANTGEVTPDSGSTGLDEDTRPIAGGIVVAPDKRRKRLQGSRFVFTSAQNNTYVHEDFLASLLQFCEARGASLFVSTFAYNKHGFQNGTKDAEDLWYDPRIKDYILNESSQVAEGIVFCGELDILPTAVDPLSGFENYTQHNSGIVPHTKVQMKSLPRMKTEDPRFLFTTGAVTQRNYIQRKAGQKAEFHHVFGALYVEVNEDGEWFARQLIAGEDGTFYDLTDKFTPLGVEEGHSVAAIAWGDIHQEKLDVNVFHGAWGDGSSMLRVLNPDVQFMHDLTDFTARNHHNIRDPFFLAQMFHANTGNVKDDLIRSAKFLAFASRYGTKTVVVDSNHDQALERWLREADIRQDPENAEYYHYAMHLKHQAIRIGNGAFSIYEHTLRSSGLLDDRVQFLAEDDSYVVAGIEHGMHGHRGPNGARGNPKGFKHIGRKVNIGHMHSAGIIDGVYVAGLSGLMDMGYNKGPSSWSHSHIITYRNGKRAIITMRGQRWKA